MIADLLTLEVLGIAGAVLAGLGGAVVFLLRFSGRPSPPSPPKIDTAGVDKAAKDAINRRASERLAATKEEANEVEAIISGAEDPTRAIAEIMRRHR